MKKQHTLIALYIILALIGLGVVAYGFWGSFTEETEAYQGIAFGLGSGTFGVCLAQLGTMILYKKHPEKMVEKNIEVNDERNVTIMEKAKSKVYGLETLLFPIIIIIMVALKTSFPYIAGVLVYFGFRTIFFIYYTNKYNKEM